jgi:sigma-B regulation protein RsbU (phosphoserine phosphatase)
MLYFPQRIWPETKAETSLELPQIKTDTEFGIEKGRFLVPIGEDSEKILRVLDADWEFYWIPGEFDLSDMESIFTSGSDVIFSRPGEPWTELRDTDGNLYPRSGTALYRIQLTLAPSGPFPPDSISGDELWIRMPDIASAYSLYQNRILVFSSGEVHPDPEQSRSFLRPAVFPLISSYHLNRKEANRLGDKMGENLEHADRKIPIELILVISNKYNNRPGTWGDIFIGSRKEILGLERKNLSRDLFLFGAIFILSLYHFGVYLLNGKEKASLYFSAFSQLIAIRIGLTGERVLYYWIPKSEFIWDWLFRLEFIGFFALPLAMMYYLEEIIPDSISPKFIGWMRGITLGFLLGTLFPLRVLTSLATPFLIWILILIIILGYNLIQSYSKNRLETQFYLWGLLSLFAFAFIDLGLEFFGISGYFFTSFGLLGFMLLQGLAISFRLAYHFRKTKRLTISLQDSNQELMSLRRELERKVIERTDQLNRTLGSIQKDMEIAQKIQGKMVPDPEMQIPGVNWKFLFQPLHQVGGDIFDIVKFQDGRVRIFLADALGHGVQGALLTMLIKSEIANCYELEDVKSALEFLKKTFENKYNHLKTYFSAILVDLIPAENRLIYASFGHPIQFLFSQNRILEIKPTGPIIGLRTQNSVSSCEYPWKSGDRLFLFTDGIFEHTQKSKNFFGMEMLQEQLTKSLSLDLGLQIIELQKSIQNFMSGQAIQDDMTILAFERS